MSKQYNNMLCYSGNVLFNFKFNINYFHFATSFLKYMTTEKISFTFEHILQLIKNIKQFPIK